MKIRIISCGVPSYWYANKIGAEFEALILKNNQAVVPIFDGTISGNVEPEDYKIIDDEYYRTVKVRVQSKIGLIHADEDSINIDDYPANFPHDKNTKIQAKALSEIIEKAFNAGRKSIQKEIKNILEIS